MRNVGETMRVTKKILIPGITIAVMVAVRLIFAFGPGWYEAEPSLRLPDGDPGAGKLTLTGSACFRAAQQHRGTPCSEPKEAAADAPASERVHALLTRAVFDIDMLDTAKALKEADAAISLDADSAQARHLASRIAMTLGDLDRAEREVRIALRLHPRDPHIGTTYAMLLLARGATREAVGVLNDVISRSPDYLFARSQRAMFFAYLGQCCSRANYKVALDDYDFLIGRTPLDPVLFSQRAAIRLAIGQPEAAIEDLSAALKLAPDRVDLMISRADTYRAAGRDDLAVKDYDSILAEASPGVPLYIMPPDRSAKLLVARAQSLVRLKRFTDAARDVVMAMTAGGKPAILRAQVFLRRHGYPDVPIDGENSTKLRQALAACFGLDACYRPVMQAI
jgi:Tfp pilus assembly protein PilF